MTQKEFDERMFQLRTEHSAETAAIKGKILAISSKRKELQIQRGRLHKDSTMLGGQISEIERIKDKTPAMRVGLSLMHKERREIEIKIQELKIDGLTLAMERDELEQEHRRIGEKYYRLKTELLRDAPERHYSESDLVSLAETVAELTAAGSCNLAMKDIVDQWKKSKE